MDLIDAEDVAELMNGEDKENASAHAIGRNQSTEAGVVPKGHRSEAVLGGASHGLGYCRRGSTRRSS